MNCHGPLQDLFHHAVNVSMTFRSKAKTKTNLAKHMCHACPTQSESFSETTIIDYEWIQSVSYTLRVFSGSDPKGSNSVELLANTGTVTLITKSKNMPRPENAVSPPQDVEIAYLVQSIGPNLGGFVPFKISRDSKESCKTPRRNPQVDAALTFLNSLSSWAGQVNYHFQKLVDEVNNTRGGAGSNELSVQVDLQSLFDTEEVFVPVLPLMDKNRARGGATNQVCPFPPLPDYLFDYIYSQQHHNIPCIMSFKVKTFFIRNLSQVSIFLHMQIDGLFNQY
jgi:hypothetical protein